MACPCGNYSHKSASRVRMHAAENHKKGAPTPASSLARPAISNAPSATSSVRRPSRPTEENRRFSLPAVSLLSLQIPQRLSPSFQSRAPALCPHSTLRRSNSLLLRARRLTHALMDLQTRSLRQSCQEPLPLVHQEGHGCLLMTNMHLGPTLRMERLLLRLIPLHRPCALTFLPWQARQIAQRRRLSLTRNQRLSKVCVCEISWGFRLLIGSL